MSLLAAITSDMGDDLSQSKMLNNHPVPHKPFSYVHPKELSLLSLCYEGQDTMKLVDASAEK